MIDIGLTTFVPRFGHLPYVMGEGNKKLSKRDPESNLFHHRDRGFIPEGLVNYLALLGWSLTHDRDVFSIDEMIAAFDVENVNPNPARFDLKKAESINGDHIRLLAPSDFEERIVPYLAGIVSDPPTPLERAILREAAPLVQERVGVLGEVRGLLEFFFVADDAIEYDADALPGDGWRAGARRLRRGARAADGLVESRDRGDPARGADRRRRPQAAGGLRSAADGAQRTADQPAAVRVDGDPRQGVHPRPARPTARAPLRDLIAQVSSRSANRRTARTDKRTLVPISGH